MVSALLVMLILDSQVSATRLKSVLEHLGGYHTRNTNSPECRKAAEWVAESFRAIPGLSVELMEYPVVAGRRIVKDQSVVQVIATLKGETDRKIIVGGHLDSYNLEGDPMTAAAPGVNDDGSGVALTMECARILSQKRHKNTLVFAVFTGEEQGLLGSGALAKRAVMENWAIEAVLSNDTVGGGTGALGQKDKKRVRVYSEESADHNSRELARFIHWNSKGKVKNFEPWLVLRKDRFQRGGDHTPFNQNKFTAVRFVEAMEDFSRQHTAKDTMDGIDLTYLSNVVRLNVLNLVSLAGAELAPTNVRYESKQWYDTTLRWKAMPGVKYVVYWRESSSNTWQGATEVGAVDSFVVRGKNKDDHVFAVGAVGGIPVSAG
jgi:hypothetical protein